jgi:hypothetical protein
VGVSLFQYIPEPDPPKFSSGSRFFAIKYTNVRVSSKFSSFSGSLPLNVGVRLELSAGVAYEQRPGEFDEVWERQGLVEFHE